MMSSNPDAVTSTARAIWASSNSSFTSRSSETKRVSSSSAPTTRSSSEATKPSDVGSGQPEVRGDTRECRARTDPELADRGIRVELGRGPVGTLTEVEHGLVTVLARLEHEHGVGFCIRSPPGEVREGGVGAERVVGVVAALLQRSRGHHETLARERGRHPLTAACRPRRLLARRREGFGALRPAGGDGVEEPAREGCLAVRRGLDGLLRSGGDRVAVGGESITPVSHRRRVSARSARRAFQLTTMGRWSLPEPSSVRITTEPVTVQSGVAMT